MKRSIFFLVILVLVVLVIAGTSQGFQGRMGGMGDPYGLIADESDFLIHPSKIAKGEGVRFYGDYRFTYTGVLDWDHDLDQFNTAGTLTNYFHFDTSGQEYSHNALLGAAFPLGPGRMGAFFSYDGMRGDYDGDEDVLGTSNYAEYELTKDLDNFAVRLMYGLPVLGMDAGLELGMAYRDEQQKTWLQIGAFGTLNNFESLDVPYESLLGFMIPYDSQYWELLWKAGIEKELGPLGVNVSLRGGYIISSDNIYEDRFGPTSNVADLEGDVAGWRIGSDIWLRYAMAEGLVLPFLVSIDYAEKTRDGDGIGIGTFDPGILYDYTHKEQSLDLKAGGGVEKKLGNNTLIAGSIYYNYLQRSDDASFIIYYIPTPYSSDNNDFPSHTEHRVSVRLAGEMELSPAVTLRMGLEPFYGWVQEDFTFTRNFIQTDDIALNGYHWGIGGSLGGTVSFNNGFTLEPFFNVGYQQFDLDGDGDRTVGGAIINLWEMDLSRSEWYIGGGCSFLFDLP
jgi:hypothetical protein